MSSFSSSFCSFLLLLPLSFLEITLGNNVFRIYSTSEFISFLESNDPFSGTTVYLESDIDLSGRSYQKSQFNGTFDGQGHTISNLVIKSSSYNIGLFRDLYGTVRNVVVDSSCSVISNYTGSNNAWVGSIAAQIKSIYDNSTISNVVNMGSVSFVGNASGKSGFLMLGGIIGYMYSPSDNSYSVTIRDCVNYGTIKHSGAAESGASIGGIVGGVYSCSSIYIQNCLTYSGITVTGTSGKLYIGGIIGNGDGEIDVTNCMNAGAVTASTGYKSGVVGRSISGISITHCLWTSGSGYTSVYGYTLSSTPSAVDSTTATISATTVSSLNQYATSNSWNKWVLNTNSKTVTFNIGTNKAFSFTSQIVLLPTPVSGWRNFYGWYTDTAFKTQFTAASVSAATALYGRWDMCLVVFNANGGTTPSFSSKEVSYNSAYDAFPATTRTGHSFAGWYSASSGGEKKETSNLVSTDHTLYAHWTANSYTVKFDANGGEELEEPTKNVTYNDAYGNLPNVTREGYMFNGWFNENNEIVTNETVVSISGDHTLTAQWKEISTNYVEIILDTKDLTKEEIKDIIKRYANDDEDDFVITKIESESGKTRVIIKFIDAEKALSFVENVRASDDPTTKKVITKVGYISGKVASFSVLLNISTIFFYLSMI